MTEQESVASFAMRTAVFLRPLTLPGFDEMFAAEQCDAEVDLPTPLNYVDLEAEVSVRRDRS